MIEFQFHKGTIKPLSMLQRTCRFTHFNSIKVRLNRGSIDDFCPYYLFQFHKGTIKPKMEQ